MTRTHLASTGVKVEATEVEGRKVYSVRAFNGGVASYLSKLPTLWIEGEITELRRQDRWASVFFTLKDPEDGACLSVQMPRGQFDALRLGLGDGERVHVFGRPELYAQRGELRLKALTIERYGVGAHLAALERLKRTLAAEGLFDDSRKRTAAALPAADRARHRQRRRRETRRAHAHRPALPTRERRSSPRPTSKARARPLRSARRSATSVGAVPT